MFESLAHLPGIYIMSIITTIIASIFVGVVIFRKLPKSDYKVIGLCILLELPMSYAMFKFVRMPFDGWFRPLMAGQMGVYKFLTIFYAPLTEEVAKLWPLLIPFVYRSIRKDNFVRIALALGLGFGIGEIWFLANLLNTTQPAVAHLPWYQLSGFLNERLIVCFMHGAFTSVTLYTLYRYKSIKGIFGSMALHYFGNFPIYLMAINFLNLGKPTWTTIVGLYLGAYFILMVGILAYFTFGKFSVMRFLWGQVRCPECKQIYNPTILAFNSFNKRYEKCPHCKHWHWTGKDDQVK